MHILLATTNAHKIKEFHDLLEILLDELPRTTPAITYSTLSDYPDYIPPEETGSTLEENALIKAHSAATQLNLYALAEDSGLFVPALGTMSPGIYSGRYAGDSATSSDNRKRLILELERKNLGETAAYYEAFTLLVSPVGKTIAQGYGRCSGKVLAKELGESEFGYDRLFLPDGSRRTFAQLTHSEKNLISHRRRALETLLHRLAENNMPSKTI
jgi:XTP/dITP diphosphohydrolase